MLLSKLPRTDDTENMPIELSSEANPVKLSDSDLATKLREIAQIASPIERKTELLSILDGLDHGRLIDLIDQSVAIFAGKRLQVALEIMFAYLTQENPKLAFEKIWTMKSVHRSGLVAVVFGEWSLSDIDGALRSANELTGLYEDIAVRSIFSSGGNLTDSQLLEVARVYGNESIAEQEISDSNARLLMDQPWVAFNHALTDSVEDDAQFGLLAEIASVWVRQDSRDAFVPMFQALDEVYQDNHFGLHRQLIGNAVESDPPGAWQALLSLAADTQLRYCRAVLDAWVKVDPVQAFEAVSQMANRSSHYNVRNSAIYAWARVAPHDLLDYVPLLAQEHRASALSAAIFQLARHESIEEALEQLNRMKVQGEDTREAIEQIARIWSFIDIEAALDWLFENADPDIYSHWSVTDKAMGRLSLEDPTKAMEIALSQPFNEANPGVAMEVSVIRALASHGRFDEVMELLDEVREEPVRVQAIMRVGSSLIQFNRPNDAMQLARELPEARKYHYTVDMAKLWFDENPVQLVEWLESNSDKRVQAQVARSIFDRPQFKNLTQEQISRVEVLLKDSEEDA